MREAFNMHEIIGDFSLGRFSESASVIKESHENFLHNKDLDVGNSKLVHTPEGTKKFIILETLLEKENAIGLSRVYVRVKVGTFRYPWGYTGNIKEYEVEWRNPEERGGSFGNCYLSREYLTFLFIYSCTGEFYHRNAPERFRRPDKIIDDWVCYAASVYGQKGVASRQGSPLCPEIDKHF